jgi:TrmH RNA methyltransferase
VVLLCGLPAVLGCFQKRPAALRRLWLAPELEKPLAEVCRWFAREKRPYVRADARELARAAGHAAHGGVVAVTERPPPATPRVSDYEAWRAEGKPLLFLEDIGDPLQIGAIARVAAAMGVPRLLLGGASVAAAYNERAWSVAAGALDLLTLHDAGAPAGVLRALHGRFCVVGFTRPGGRRVDELKPIRVPGRPLAVVIGDTETGISANVAGKCEHLLHIPGAEGSALLNAGDTAAFGLPWLLRRERVAATGFLAKKRERRAAAKAAASAGAAAAVTAPAAPAAVPEEAEAVARE